MTVIPELHIGLPGQVNSAKPGDAITVLARFPPHGGPVQRSRTIEAGTKVLFVKAQTGLHFAAPFDPGQGPEPRSSRFRPAGEAPEDGTLQILGRLRRSNQTAAVKRRFLETVIAGFLRETAREEEGVPLPSEPPSNCCSCCAATPEAREG